MPLPSPDSQMRRAARHHLAGELREAAALYRRVLQEHPQHAGALHALGVMAQQTGRLDAAEKLLLRAVATNPSLAAAHDDLGALWLIQGKTQQAAAAFGEAVRVDPKYARAHAHLGAAMAALGRHDDAAAAYQRAVDSATSSLRRFKAVGIDISAITQPLADRPIHAEESTPYAEEDDASESSESVMTLVDDDDDEGVVGLTLLKPGVPLPTSPLAARAQEIEYAYATMAGLPAAAPWAVEELHPAIQTAADEPAFWPNVGDEPAMNWTLSEPDVYPPREMPNGFALHGPIEPDAVWHVPDPAAFAPPSDATSHADGAFIPDPAVFVPQIDVEVEQGRHDGGAFATGFSTFAPAASDGEQARRLHRDAVTSDVAGFVPTDVAATGTASLLSSDGEPATAADVPPQSDVAVAPIEVVESPMSVAVSPALTSAAWQSPIAIAPAFVAAEGISTIGVTEPIPLAPDPSLTTITADTPVMADAPAIGVVTTVSVQRATAEPPAVDNDADFAPLEQDAGLVDLPADDGDDDAGSDAVDILPARPAAMPKVSLPPSASRLTDDPVLAPRMLAKELRRARRKPVAGAKQAAELHRQGTSHLRQRRVDEAIAALERLVELQPTSAKAHRDLGAAYIRGDRTDDAIASLQKALELRPRFADALASLGDAYHLQGRVEEAVNCYRQTLALRPSAASAHSNLLLNLNYQRKSEPAALYAEHQKWAKAHAHPLMREIVPPANDPTPDRVLRIGYVSPDFRRHAVGSFIEPILAQRDPEAFHIVCYSDVVRPDDTTERISQMCDGWRDCRGIGDADLAEMIREDRIDILVDLAGHTGGNRLCVFARKPAPVQVTYLGYPNTTGLPTMDYRLTDAWADPLGQSEQYHSEQLYRLPKGFLCYQGPAEAPTPAAPPVVKNGFVTFGCFNILAKLTPETLGLWAKIMTVLPKSRIVLKDRLGTFANPARRRWVQDIFAYHRITADRLDLLEKEPDRMKHLESYGKVDLMLDPFPYNGTTTTCEALWMGVPVITLTGNRHAGRVGVSILKSAGLPEFISPNLEGYARSAVLLARDVSRLTLLRRTLRQKVAASSLCDAEKFTKILGLAYREMWTFWCQTRGKSAMLMGSTPKAMEG